METELEQRYREAEQRLTDHVAYMKQRENEFATQREIALLQHQHADNLRVWSSLKMEMDKHGNNSTSL